MNCVDPEEITLGSLIGEGKVARVYYGSHLSIPNISLVLRVLKYNEAAVLNNQLRECNQMELVHPNIVNIYGVILSKKAFIHELCTKQMDDCGELVNIHSLLGLLAILEEHLENYTKLICIRHVSSALGYLHNLNIIVGDLKPSNILVTSTTIVTWVFKLADCDGDIHWVSS